VLYIYTFQPPDAASAALKGKKEKKKKKKKEKGKDCKNHGRKIRAL